MAIEWWYQTAASHSAADEECGRAWVCACGPCTVARKELRGRSHYDVLRFGAKQIVLYQRAMSAEATRTTRPARPERAIR